MFARPWWLLLLLVVAALARRLRAGCSVAGSSTCCGSPTSRCSRRSPRSGRAGGGTCRWRCCWSALVFLTVALAGPDRGQAGPAQPGHRDPGDRRVAVDGGHRRGAEPARRSRRRPRKAFADGLTRRHQPRPGRLRRRRRRCWCRRPPTARPSRPAIDNLQLSERTAHRRGDLHRAAVDRRPRRGARRAPRTAARPDRAALRRQADGARETRTTRAAGSPRARRGEERRTCRSRRSRSAPATARSRSTGERRAGAGPTTRRCARSRTSPAAVLHRVEPRRTERGLRHPRGADRLRDHTRRRQSGRGCPRR